MQKRIRLIVDISMTVLLPLLMAYSLIGELFHEIIGTIIFILFVTHHILNRKWSASLFKGSYSMSRIFRTAVDLLLLIFMILQPLSGILMSKHLYTFLPALPVSAQTRAIHMLLAYWGYVLMCVHAGTHLTVLMSKQQKRDKTIRNMRNVLLSVISFYGIYAFIKRGFPGYMSGRTMFAYFDYSEPLVFFLLDHLSVMILFMMAGYLMTMIVRHVENHS